MNTYYKRVLYINISDLTYEFKIHEDLSRYIGGIGVGYKLLLDNLDVDPVIIAAGPLSGYFPYISKCTLIYTEKLKIVEKFGGGNIAANMNMSNIDAIVIYGYSVKDIFIDVFEKELSISHGISEMSLGKSYDLEITKSEVNSLGYFAFGSTGYLFEKLGTQVKININFSDSQDFSDYYEYEKLYNEALDFYKQLTVEPGNFPSCYGCPIGCEKSKQGEDSIKLSVLPRSLIACGYAEQIYKNIPFVYACLNSIGYSYRHEELETISEDVGKIKIKIDEALNR